MKQAMKREIIARKKNLHIELCLAMNNSGAPNFAPVLPGFFPVNRRGTIPPFKAHG